MILLTGATGFLGSRLLKELLKKQYDVICIKRNASDLARVEDIQDKCKWISIDQQGVEAIFKEYDIDIVIHCATNYGRDGANAFSVYDSNLVFPLKLLECANEYGCRLFINTSTFFVREIDVLWNQEKIYMDSYVKSKFIWSHIVKDNIEQLNFGFVNLQLEHIYGNDGRKSKFVDRLLSELCSNKKSIALTEGKQIRDWIYIDDVVAAYITVLNNLESFYSGAYYHYEVGTGKETSLREFVLKAHELAGSVSDLEFGAREMENNELMYSCADNKKLCELGWQPQVNIEQGIREMLKEVNK